MDQRSLPVRSISKTRLLLQSQRSVPVEPGPGRQPSKIDLPGVDLPPGRPGVAALLPLGGFRAQRHLRGRFTGQLISRVLDLADMIPRQDREQIDQRRHAVFIVVAGQGQGDTHSDKGRVILRVFRTMVILSPPPLMSASAAAAPEYADEISVRRGSRAGAGFPWGSARAASVFWASADWLSSSA